MLSDADYNFFCAYLESLINKGGPPSVDPHTTFFCQVNVIICEQSVLASSNSVSSYYGQHLKTIKSSLDLIVWFPSAEKELRTYLQSIESGNAYRKAKKIAQIATVDVLSNFSNRSLFDHRNCHPYLSMILNKATNQSFRFRETLFNLNNEKSLPLVPPAFIWGNNEDFPAAT